MSISPGSRLGPYEILAPLEAARLRAKKSQVERFEKGVGTTSTRRLVVFTACVVGLLVAGPAVAQHGVKRTVLNQADLSGAPGMEIASSIVEF